MAEPPSEEGAVQASETWALPAVACRDCGALGALAGALGVAFASFEATLSPIAFRAVTL